MVYGSHAGGNPNSQRGGDGEGGIQDDEAWLVGVVAKELFVVRNFVGAGSVRIILAARQGGWDCYHRDHRAVDFVI